LEYLRRLRVFDIQGVHDAVEQWSGSSVAMVEKDPMNAAAIGFNVKKVKMIASSCS
jgi:hypothetical protein